MQRNYFDQFDAPASQPGSFTIGTPDPDRGLSATHPAADEPGPSDGS
jgi:hypothetical protein